MGLVNTHYCLLPIPVVIQAPRKVSQLQHPHAHGLGPRLICLVLSMFTLPCSAVQVDPRGKAWARLRAAISQPDFV